MNKIAFNLFLVLGLGQLAAHPGIGIVMDSQGNVYYTDLAQVWKITPNGSHVLAVKDVHTHELYIDEEDNLYGEHVWYEGEATDQWGYYVWCLSRNGELSKTIQDSKGFPVNNTLQRDQAGTTYWTEKWGEQEILKRRTTKGEIQAHSSHKFRDIRWLHVPGKEGEVYVVDFLQLKKVEPGGKVRLLSDNLKEGRSLFNWVRDHHYVMGVWSDQVNNIYVALYGARKVKKFKPDGASETIFTSSKGWAPSGGLIGKDGSLWVMEFSIKNETRVKRIDRNGEVACFGKK